MGNFLGQLKLGIRKPTFQVGLKIMSNFTNFACVIPVFYVKRIKNCNFCTPKIIWRQRGLLKETKIAAKNKAIRHLGIWNLVGEDVIIVHYLKYAKYTGSYSE